MRIPEARSHVARDRGRWRVTVLLVLSVAVLAWVARLAPLPQDTRYHDFADQRRLLGVPHFWNVISNLPFAVIGLLGCTWLVRAGKGSAAFDDPAERRAYFAFFCGEFLTCFGSAYYHLAPSNATLVWDRLVFSLLLTSFFAIVVTEFVSRRAGSLLLAPMLVLGLSSVLYWRWSELAGRGDLRPYLSVQFYPVLAVPVIALLFRSRYPASGALLATWALYVVAKAAEFYDGPVYDLTGFWSGHTVKHLVAAGASYLPLEGLRRRTRALAAHARGRQAASQNPHSTTRARSKTR